MLKKLILENWKSFRYAELPIDPLTVLIGTNASGKSNAIEALEFFKRIALGEHFQNSFTEETKSFPIRGGIDWITLKNKTSFTLKILIQSDNCIDYLHSITVQTIPEVQLLFESLLEIQQIDSEESEILLFETENSSDLNSNIVAKFNNQEFKIPSSEPSRDFSVDLRFGSDASFSSLGLLDFMARFRDKNEGIKNFLRKLKSIFILSPMPSKMRSYSSLSDELLSDASNIAGVLAALPYKEKAYVESVISSFVAHLPEKDIQKVWAEPVGRLSSDAMLYCEETWISGEPSQTIDAKAMSDGTLRFIAILTALLTRPEGSQLVIEEVDAGLHPSRAELLLKMLREIGGKRKIDILVTTHNPALLNALEPEMLPFIIVAHRDPQTGESKLTPLDNLQNLAKLLAGGQIGDLASRGAIEKSLSRQ